MENFDWMWIVRKFDPRRESEEKKGKGNRRKNILMCVCLVLGYTYVYRSRSSEWSGDRGMENADCEKPSTRMSGPKRGFVCYVMREGNTGSGNLLKKYIVVLIPRVKERKSWVVERGVDLYSLEDRRRHLETRKGHSNEPRKDLWELSWIKKPGKDHPNRNSYHDILSFLQFYNVYCT